jgi:hypothetical protein
MEYWLRVIILESGSKSKMVRGVGKSPRFTSKTGVITLKNWKNILCARMVEEI